MYKQIQSVVELLRRSSIYCNHCQNKRWGAILPIQASNHNLAAFGHFCQLKCKIQAARLLFVERRCFTFQKPDGNRKLLKVWQGKPFIFQEDVWRQEDQPIVIEEDEYFHIINPEEDRIAIVAEVVKNNLLKSFL